MTLLTPAQAAAQLTAQFAANGLGPEDIRAKVDPMSLGSTIDVTILRLGIRLEVVDTIVRAHQEPQFDERNEMLLGWNRHVDVRYARAALAPLLAEALRRINGMEVGEARQVGGCIVSRSPGTSHSWEVELKLDPDFTPRAYAAPRGAAMFVAQYHAARGHKAIP
jgi:hypothetical protein